MQQAAQINELNAQMQQLTEILAGNSQQGTPILVKVEQSAHKILEAVGLHRDHKLYSSPTSFGHCEVW